MASLLAHRILAISIIIALCSPPTSGFTVHRIESAAPTTQADLSQNQPDLTSEESVQLQVKDLTRRPNDINNGKDSTKAAENKQKQELVTLHVNGITPTAEVFISDIRLPNSAEKTEAKGENKTSVSETFQFVSNNSETKTNNENSTDIISDLITEINDVLSILPDVSVDPAVTSTNTDQVAIDTDTTVSLTTEKQSSGSPSDITTQAITKTENDPKEITTIPKEAVSESQDEGEIIFKKVSENNTPQDKISQSNNDMDISTDVTFAISLTTEKQSSDSPSDITTQAITKTENDPEEITTIPKEAVSESQDEGEIIFMKVSENDTPQDNISQSNNDMDISTDVTFTISLTTEKPSDITTQAITVTENGPEEINAPPKVAVSELQDEGEIFYRKVSENDKTKDKVSLSNNDIEISTGVTFNDEEQITATEPSWKKYVTIDRKRTSSEDLATESTVDDYMFAKPTDKISPLIVPPLERIDLQSEYNHQITSAASDQDITTIENNITENDQVVSSLKTDDKRLIKYSIDTKRAGFLDYSKTSPYESMTSTTEVNESNEPQSTKRPKTNQLHSDMSDDAIKEEFLREEIMNNVKQNQENIRLNSYNYHAESAVHASKVTSSTESGDVSSSADPLSVRPIHNDRKTTLYTISPNYKPMKKIDVQPPKLFVRDPDDNSWRNESISSLGIVFKPKNASKSFKEVLKSKTETEFGMLLDSKDSKNEVPDLRLRLEKIAEVRKSKKKKTNKAGEVVYIDYEENSSAEGTTNKMESHLETYSTTTALPETTTLNTYHKIYSEIDDIFKKFKNEADMTTEKPNKYFNDYYDATDEDEDYVTLPNIDLKKYTRFSVTDPPTTSTVMRHHTPAFVPSTSFTPPPANRFPSFPERKPTIDYFPPRTTTPKVNIDHYDDSFEKKVNYYTSKEKTEFIYPTDPVATDKPSKPQAPTKSIQFTAYPRTISPPRLSSPHGFVPNEGNFNRGSYVIKHYKDILRDAVKSNDDVEDFSYTDPKISQRFPEEEEQSSTAGKEKAGNQDYLDYDTQFRREVLNRFLDNFNQNSEKYKIDFPILYNNSVVHQKYDEEGRVSASSSTFVKGLHRHHIQGPSRSDKAFSGRYCEPHCDLAVELSPAYELHYYVPDQEEKEQVDVPYSLKVSP